MFVLLNLQVAYYTWVLFWVGFFPPFLFFSFFFFWFSRWPFPVTILLAKLFKLPLINSSAFRIKVEWVSQFCFYLYLLKKSTCPIKTACIFHPNEFLPGHYICFVYSGSSIPTLLFSFHYCYLSNLFCFITPEIADYFRLP